MARTFDVGLAASFVLVLTASGMAATPGTGKKLGAEVKALRQENREMREELARMRAMLERLTASTAQVKAQLIQADEKTRQVERLENEVSQAKMAFTTHVKESVSYKDLTPGGNRLKVYGFVRADVENHTSMPSNQIFPVWIRSPVESRNETRSLIFHARNSRLGLDYGPTRLDHLGQPKASAKVEVDFHQVDPNNSFPESREMFRMRLGYVRLDWDRSYLLFGQDWDLVGPLHPGVSLLSILWFAGNLGDRREMIHWGWSSKGNDMGWAVAGSAGLAGAVDNLRDPDTGNGLRGAGTGEPIYQGRVGYTDIWKKRKDKFQVSVWGHRMHHGSDRPINGRRRFDSHSVGVSAQLPVADTLTVKTERWWGSNLIDIRGGIGQWINTTTGEEIASVGGFEELWFSPVQRYSLLLGHSEDHPGFENVPLRGRTDNRTVYVGHRYRPGGRLEFGLDWINWQTRYVGLPRGQDNHVTLFAQQTF